MELILVRHAEPVPGKVSSGSSADPSLSERGARQAADVAKWLARGALQRVISSPALRSRSTAMPCAERAGLEIDVDDRLRDASAGGAEYVPLEVDKARNPAAYRARVADYLESPRLADLSGRVNEALDEWCAKCHGQRIAVFCHGSVINVFASRILGLAPSAFLEAGYASGHRFMISRTGVRSVLSLNETAFLTSE
jgi:probable phosphoglycerate mutase